MGGAVIKHADVTRIEDCPRCRRYLERLMVRDSDSVEEMARMLPLRRIVLKTHRNSLAARIHPTLVQEVS